MICGARHVSSILIFIRYFARIELFDNFDSIVQEEGA